MLLALLMLFFLLFFKQIGIRLKMYTYDDVIDALHDLELKNPNVLLNIPENEKRGKKTFPKDHIPG